MADLKKYLTNPSLIFEGFFRQASSYSVFQNKTEFKVKVLNVPEPYIGFDPDAPNQTSEKRWFYGRIMDPNMPHEKYLPDPCDQSIAADEELAISIIKMHSVVYMDGTADFSVGSIVTAFVDPGVNNNKYDIQFLRFLRLDVKVEKTEVPEECLTLLDLDWGSSVVDYSSARSGNYIGGNLPARGTEVRNGLIEIDSPILIGTADIANSLYPTVLIFDAIQPYNELAAAFYEHFNSDEYRRNNPDAPQDIKLNASGYRNFDKQVELKEEKPNFAAVPGTSNHGWGMAIDIVNKDWEGKGGYESEYFLWMLEHSHKYGWYHPKWAAVDGTGPDEPWHFEYEDMGNVIDGLRASEKNTLADHNDAITSNTPRYLIAQTSAVANTDENGFAITEGEGSSSVTTPNTNILTIPSPIPSSVSQYLQRQGGNQQ
jgi:hypothetical protein